MLSLSLGALCPKPATAWLGIIVIPAAATAVVPRNVLLETEILFEFCSIIINSFNWIGIYLFCYLFKKNS
jgi:hypothetical protein